MGDLLNGFFLNQSISFLPALRCFSLSVILLIVCSETEGIMCTRSSVAAVEGGGGVRVLLWRRFENGILVLSAMELTNRLNVFLLVPLSLVCDG